MQSPPNLRATATSAGLTPGGSVGVLLVNLGTPDAPQAAEVRRYLREFLSDPRVLDISAIGRWLLLNLIILPTRPAKSAAAYRKVWGADGSPLLSHSRAPTSSATNTNCRLFLLSVKPHSSSA